MLCKQILTEKVSPVSQSSQSLMMLRDREITGAKDWRRGLVSPRPHRRFLLKCDFPKPQPLVFQLHAHPLSAPPRWHFISSIIEGFLLASPVSNMPHIQIFLNLCILFIAKSRTVKTNPLSDWTVTATVSKTSSFTKLEPRRAGGPPAARPRGCSRVCSQRGAMESTRGVLCSTVACSLECQKFYV